MKRPPLFVPLVGVLAVSALWPARGWSSDETALRVARTIDEMYRSRSSFSRMEMEVVTPQWQRKLSLEAWTQGMDKTFIRILLPKKERGVATLRLKNEMWNYLPNTNKVIKIPPSMMMGSWMGSDFTNDDLVREYNLVEDYAVEITVPENADKSLLHILCRPKPGLPVIWDSVLIAVRLEDSLPVWEKYYDEKGKLIRQMNFSDIREFGPRKVPAIMELVPQNKEGHKTVIRFLEIRFDTKVDEGVFTLKNLSAVF